MASKMLQEFVLAVTSDDFVVLDMETTGLKEADIVQIAVVDQDGDVLVDTLVKPTKPITWSATNVHGIAASHVQDAPTWKEVWMDVANAIAGRNVLVYNVNFDRKVLYSATDIARLTVLDWKRHADWFCAMLAFAESYGDWDGYRFKYKWQTLGFAVSHLEIAGHDAHSALGDCLATLAVSKAIAAVGVE